VTTTPPTRIGKPTVAACVGSIFAQVRHDDRVVAVDADTAFGKLGARVDLYTTGSYWDLAGPPTSTSTPSPTCARRSDDPPPSCHRLDPLHVPLEAKRGRHRAVTLPIVAIGGVVAMGSCQQRPQPQQPDVADNQPVIGWHVG